jgi:hypothetical protein
MKSSASPLRKRFGAVLAAGALLGAQHAYAAQVGVTATVNPGTACTAELSAKQFAYGNINTSQLSASEPTALPAKPITLTVACAPFASKFFFRVIDRNPNRVNMPEYLGRAAGVPEGDYLTGMGLGMTGHDRPLGELFLKSTALLADAQKQVILQSYGGGEDPLAGGWNLSGSAFFWGTDDGMRRYMLANAISEIAHAAKNFTIQMEVIPVISPSALDGLANDAKLDSKFTIEITQL